MTSESLRTRFSSGIARVRRALRDDFSGPDGAELLEAQKTVVLSRTLVLIGISVFVMPSTIWAYVFFARPEALPLAIVIVLAAIGAVLVIRWLVRRGAFDKHWHLSMVLLVGGVFGPTGTAIVELTHGSGGDFFFSYFLIFFAFTSLYPATVGWVLVTSSGVTLSWLIGHFFRPGGLVPDQRFYESLLYLFQLTFIGVVLNRVVTRLFLAERRASIALRQSRDSLIAEMKVARQIQQLLLPRDPRLPGFDIHGVMMPADDVGGDYFDVLKTRTGRTLVAIGDVSGHGVTAGVTTMMTRSTLVAALEAEPAVSLPSLYTTVSNALSDNLRRMQLRIHMTFLLFEHLGAGRFCFVGSHLPALIWRREQARVEEIEGDGMWLGVMDDLAPTDVPEASVELRPGDVLLLYTDGIVERREPGTREMFGYDRLSRALAAHATEGSSRHLVEGLIAAMRAHSHLQDDDVTLLALRYQG